MRAYLRLIRWKNLIIIAATMFILKYFMLIPVYEYYGQEVFYSDIGFFFLCFSILLIAAGGNVINDYFDRKTDYINRPNKVLVVFKVKRRTVILFHWILSIFGIIAGFFAAYYAGSIFYGLFFILMVLLLWKYSTILKKTVFWGNFTVALLVATAPALVGATEYLAAKNFALEIGDVQLRAIKVSAALLFGYAVFAFAYNFIREIVKDNEDFKGDSKTGVKSMAVLVGRRKANILVAVLVLITAAAVAVSWHFYISELPFFSDILFGSLYIWGLIILPSLYVLIKSLTAVRKKDYSYMSRVLKMIMIAGILFSFIVSIVIHGNT